MSGDKIIFRLDKSSIENFTYGLKEYVWGLERVESKFKILQ